MQVNGTDLAKKTKESIEDLTYHISKFKEQEAIIRSKLAVYSLESVNSALEMGKKLYKEIKEKL